MILSKTVRPPHTEDGNSNSRSARSKSLSSESLSLERKRAREQEKQEHKRDFDRRTRHHNLEQDSVRRNNGNYRHEMDILNEHFKHDIARLESSLCSMRFVERSIGTEWITKLKADQSNINDARARNEILSYLLKCFNDNVFNREPFNKPPQPTNLFSIKKAMKLTSDTPCMMATANDKGKRKYLSELFNDLYDDGDFLSQLPVPRDGAFFVLLLRPNL